MFQNKKGTVVVALGGNAILQEKQKGTVEEQLANIRQSCDPIIELLDLGYRVVLTHGNGPQVGANLLKTEAASGIVPPAPLDVCVAETQGSLGYLIQQCLQNRLKELGKSIPVVTMVTQVLVDEKDPAFLNPTKPIGPFYSKERAEEIQKEKACPFVEDAGRGYRRVVPSPQPLDIVEKTAVNTLLSSGAVVIAAGGGGIPVSMGLNGQLQGVEAVIDKDHASAALAHSLKANLFLILTGVDQVAINFRQPEEKALKTLTVAEAKKYLAAGHFPPGSMGPKIAAAVHFLELGGKEVLITSLNKLREALAGTTGTRLVRA